jgi:glycosyltransferase involved in cell wall biosynthesis
VRLLAVTHAYPRRAGDPAGAFLQRLYVALVARGHSVHVLAPADVGQGGVEEHGGIVVERVRYAAPHRETLAYRGTMEQAARTPSGAVAFRGLITALARAVRTRAAAADVIHANWWVPGGLAVRRARRRGVALPYVLTLHGTDAALLRRSRLARWLARPVLREAGRVTAVSGFLGDAARRAGAAAPVVLPMPAEVERFTRRSAGGGGVVTVGRLSAQKRLDLLIEAVARLHAAGRATSLTIVGDGPERTNLEALVRRRALGAAVRFLGARAPDEIPGALDDADVFAFPARGEGFGLAAAEALMAGIPVVVLADGGGGLDLVGADGAVSVAPPDDADALARALAAALDDPDARSRAAGAGDTWRARLAPAAVGERLEAVLEAACRAG